MEAERYAQSEAYFRQALAIDPKLLAAWQGLGQVLDFQSKYEAALAAFREVIAQVPDSASSYLSIGQLQEKRGDFSQAEWAYHQVLQLEPDNVVAKNNLAWLLAEHDGNIDLALHLAQEANQARPDDPEICDTLGWIYIKKSAFESAIRVLTTSLELAPKNPAYEYHLGLAYLGAGERAKARALLQATIQTVPPSSYAKDARDILLAMKN